MGCNFHTWLAQVRRRGRLPSKSSSSSACTRPAGCDNDFDFNCNFWRGAFSGDGVRTGSGCAWASISTSSRKSSLRTRTGACSQSPCKGVRDTKVSASYLGSGPVDEGPSILPVEKLRYTLLGRPPLLLPVVGLEKGRLGRQLQLMIQQHAPDNGFPAADVHVAVFARTLKEDVTPGAS